MIVENECIIFFDVDDTLVMWDKSHGNQIKVPDDTDLRAKYVTPHRFHIELLKSHKARGYTVVVWSAGGYKWAQSVVRRLGLEEHVDIIMTKPIKYVDDLHCEEFMGQRLYFEDK